MTDFKLPETRYALSDDVSIAYQVMGDGPIDLLPALSPMQGFRQSLSLVSDVPLSFASVGFMANLPKSKLKLTA